MNHLPQRSALFVLGMVINSFGIAFITKAGLGTSQISSIPYVLSLEFPVSFGMTTFCVNMLWIVLQMVLLRGRFRPSQLLQVPVNVLFSVLIDVSMGLLWFLQPVGWWQRALSVVVGCAILALGNVIEVAPNVVMVPGEGIVRALSIVTGGRFGTVKVVFDVTLIAVAVVMSFVFFGRLEGVGVGTVVSALLVGTMINAINRTFRFPSRISALALSDDDGDVSDVPNRHDVGGYTLSK